MDSRIIAQLRWYAQTGINSLGPPGIVGLGLLMFCLAFYFSTLKPAQEKVVEMQVQLASLTAKASLPKVQQALAKAPEVQLGKFYRFFPKHENAPDLLEKIYATAEASGVMLEQGEYRLSTVKGEKLDQYRITLPVKGSYQKIRNFIGKVLADLPAASLDGVSFQRQNISDVEVESQIKLTLYLGDNS